MTLTTFTQLFEEYQDSGLNVLDFCSNHGIASSSFYYWRKKLIESDKAEQPKHFVPLMLNSINTDNRVSTHRVNTKTFDEDSSTSPIEFVFPNGIKMILHREAVDVVMLKTIVHLFD